ncbi:MAG: class I SAM-dependent methyltransferase, partial [Bacteroidetes bacterium]
MKQYYFKEIKNCEMCGDETSKHKILGKRLNTSQGLNPKNKTGISITVQKCSNCGLIYS